MLGMTSFLPYNRAAQGRCQNVIKYGKFHLMCLPTKRCFKYATKLNSIFLESCNIDIIYRRFERWLTYSLNSVNKSSEAARKKSFRRVTYFGHLRTVDIYKIVFC